MAERSKALRSGRSIFGCVGSNPTSVSSLFLACRLSVKTSLKIVFQHIGTNNPTLMSRCNNKNKRSQKMFYQAGWPSGLRRCVKVAVSSDAWVRIPLLSAVSVFSVSFSSKNNAEIRFSTYWDQQSDADEQI